MGWGVREGGRKWGGGNRPRQAAKRSYGGVGGDTDHAALCKKWVTMGWETKLEKGFELGPVFFFKRQRLGMSLT